MDLNARHIRPRALEPVARSSRAGSDASPDRGGHHRRGALAAGGDPEPRHLGLRRGACDGQRRLGVAPAVRPFGPFFIPGRHVFARIGWGRQVNGFRTFAQNSSERERGETKLI